MLNARKLIEDALQMSSDTKIIEIGEGAVMKVPDIFRKAFPGEKAVVIADDNTWKAAGEKVFSLMTGAGIDTASRIIHKEEFHPDWEVVEQFDGILGETGAVAVAVGSGVINDLCKIASFHHGRKYMCVATAASVDGYSSSGAVVNSAEGAKINVETHAPYAIVADTGVLAAAPKAMTAAGYGDLAAKIPAGAEWMIADLFGTEPILPDVWNLMFGHLKEMLSSPEAVGAGKPEAVGNLFAGLAVSGVAMQAAHSSRPASCAEHLYSHYLDMTHHRFRGRLQSHGDQVAVGTLTMCAFFDELLKMDLTRIDVDRCMSAWPSLEEEQERADLIYNDFPVPGLGRTEITRKYSGREEVGRQLSRVRDTWPEFREKLRDQLYTFPQMLGLFRKSGTPLCPEDIGVTREKMRYMTDFVQLMRWRINMFDLAKRACIYDDLKEKVFGRGGVWDVTAKSKSGK